MTLQLISKKKLAGKIQLADEQGKIIERSVANLLRAPLFRWGLSPKRSILRHARDQLRAVGVDDGTCVNRVLDRMIALGECIKVFVGHEVYIAPAEPRWLTVGDGVGVFLGVSNLPEGIFNASESNQYDIVQRIRITSNDDVARLHFAGVREITLSEWLSPIGYWRHASRRLRRPVKSNDVNLASFWDILNSRLAEEGLPMSEDADIRVLKGTPGQFFGHYDSPKAEGRWTDEMSEGVWCAIRRGYGEAHWHPIILAIDGAELRSLDLYDLDEWRWALLARGRKFGKNEVVRTSKESVQLTFPAPIQLRTAIDLLAVPTAPWVWLSQSEIPNVLELIA